MDKHSHEHTQIGEENRARGPQLTFNPFQSLKLYDILYQLNWSNKNNEFKTGWKSVRNKSSLPVYHWRELTNGNLAWPWSEHLINCKPLHMHMLNTGNRTGWSSIRTVIIRVILTKLGFFKIQYLNHEYD